MRVTHIEMLASQTVSTITLSFRDPTRQNPYNIKGITGLDPDEITPRYQSGSGAQKFYNLILPKRTVVFDVALNPRAAEDETYESLRDNLYRMIQGHPFGKLDLFFRDGVPTVAYLGGFVAKVESDMMAKDPSVKITIDCEEPYLRSIDETFVDVLEIDTEFPAINDTVSTAPHGFQFELQILEGDGPPTGFRLKHPGDLWTFEVIPNGGFENGDVIHFSSVYNDKYLYVQRGIQTIHLADKITPGAVWPYIYPGLNNFELDLMGLGGFGIVSANAQWDVIRYWQTFWGI